jgi:hypothetical protein
MLTPPGAPVARKLCLPFLEANLSFEALQQLKNPAPPKFSNILEELAAEGIS